MLYGAVLTSQVSHRLCLRARLSLYLRPEVPSCARASYYLCATLGCDIFIIFMQYNDVDVHDMDDWFNTE